MALIDLCRQKAAGAWTRTNTCNIPMNIELAEAFAKILEEIWSQPWLGNATTRQLIDELSARIEIDEAMDYRTVDDPIDPSLENPVSVLKGDLEFVEGVEGEEEEEPEIYEDPIYED